MYKILLIEPDVKLAKKIRTWLKNDAILVHVAHKDHVKAEASSGEWDLVITGVHTSEMNNLEITKLVKTANPATAILIIDENIKVDFILDAMKYHADGLFFKPLDKNEFITRTIQLVKEAQQKREEGKKIILAIGAHPDDVEFGCGGTLAKLHGEGHGINILTLSTGEVGGFSKVRKKEAKAAAKLQGATLFLGDFTDTNIMSNKETIQFIESIVQKVEPTHIYTHSINDSHQDHRGVYQASVIACRPVPNIYSYLSPSGTVDFRPSIFVCIDKYIEDKLRALGVYTSQIEKRPYLQADLIRATARYWGRFGRYNLVEPMEAIKESS